MPPDPLAARFARYDLLRYTPGKTPNSGLVRPAPLFEWPLHFKIAFDATTNTANPTVKNLKEKQL